MHDRDVAAVSAQSADVLVSAQLVVLFPVQNGVSIGVDLLALLIAGPGFFQALGVDSSGIFQSDVAAVDIGRLNILVSGLGNLVVLNAAPG